jgi:hypothetical protein
MMYTRFLQNEFAYVIVIWLLGLVSGIIIGVAGF